MLYQEIRHGSHEFYLHPRRWNRFYVDYLRDRKQGEWDSCSVSDAEAERLRHFLNQWSTHYRAEPHELACAVNSILPGLNLLRGEDLLHVDFGRRLPSGESVSSVVEAAFDTIVSCGGRYESTGTSKVLHVINPNLFVMWDMRIRKAYGVVGGGGGVVYAQRFLPRMQQLARTAVEQCADDLGMSEIEALRFLCPRGESLAKVIDEYNWATYVGRASRMSGGQNTRVSTPTTPARIAPGPTKLSGDVVDQIRGQLARDGGSAEIPLMNGGKSFKAVLRADGVEVDNLAAQPFLPWQVFIETMALLERRGGVAPKGNAMGPRLGDPRLPVDSVEGNIANTVYGKKTGDSLFRRVTPVAAILDWCGLCHSCRGELRLVK